VPESRLYERTPVQLLEELQVKRAESARKMYHKGEHARQAGDMAKALHYFKAAHGACPTCAFGERALKHIVAIENGLLPRDRGIGEEAEPPAAPAPPTPPADTKQSADDYEVIRSLVTGTPFGRRDVPPAKVKKDSRSRVLEGTVPLEIYLDEVGVPAPSVHTNPSPIDEHGPQVFSFWFTTASWEAAQREKSAPSAEAPMRRNSESWEQRQQRLSAVCAWRDRIADVRSTPTPSNVIAEPGVYFEPIGMLPGWSKPWIPADAWTPQWNAEATSKLVNRILGTATRGFVDIEGSILSAPDAPPHDYTFSTPARGTESTPSKFFDWLHYEHLSFRFGVVKPVLEVEQLEQLEHLHFDGPFLPGRALASAAIDYYPPSNIFGNEEVAPPAIHPHPLSTRLCAAARRLLDNLDIDIDTDSEQGLRVAVNLGGQHYLFHYSAGAWMIFVSP